MLVAALVALVIILGMMGAAAAGRDEVLSAVSLTAPGMDPQLKAELESGAAPLIRTGSIALVPGGGAALTTVTAPPAFAAVDDLALHLPMLASDPLVFMEADTPNAIPMAPVGSMVGNDNPEGYHADAPMQGPDYRILAPVTGARPATGAVAVLGAPGTALLAPVQGVVDVVEQYTTSDGAQDWRILIRPVGRSDLHVLIRHIDAPWVSVGDEVTVGLTEIGTLRAGDTIPAALNPLALPAAILQVQPAVLSPSMAPSAATASATG